MNEELETKEIQLTKAFSFEIKSLDEEGVFEGYGAIFDNVDSYNDIIVKGAFKDSLKKRKPKLLWQHNTDQPIGIYEIVKEDDIGLYVKGKLAIKTEKGREVYELLKMGALDGLSIGYSLWDSDSKYTIDEKKKTRTIQKASLYEVSLVTFPANPKALITDVKEEEFDNEDIEDKELEQKSIEGFDSVRDCEDFLKIKGLSSKESKTIISKIIEVKENSKKRDAEEKTIEAPKRDVEEKSINSKLLSEKKLSEINFLLSKILTK